MQDGQAKLDGMASARACPHTHVLALRRAVWRAKILRIHCCVGPLNLKVQHLQSAQSAHGASTRAARVKQIITPSMVKRQDACLPSQDH
mmetsp:Transcript_135527/g.270414  ORF Transcript_135527/g.270414 Transcript_135527/m.270414 type:complete len:89 (+) Transcript_135527:318-584(+)